MCFIVYVTFTVVISFNPYCSPKRQAGMICSTLSIRNLGFTKVKLLAQGDTHCKFSFHYTKVEGVLQIQNQRLIFQT